MARFAIVTTNPTCPPAAQTAHDLRNILASIGLHLETLQRLSGPNGVKAANAAYALLTRGAVLCNNALNCSTSAANHAQQRRVDLLQTVRQIADLLEPSAPKDFPSILTRIAQAMSLPTRTTFSGSCSTS